MRKLLPLFILLAVSCTPATAPPAASIAVAPPLPRLVPAAIAQRVVLVSFDGLGADALARQRALPAFTSMIRDGAAARIIPVNPTVTSSTHASILTGADPSKHGAVSNRFHLAGTPPETATRGHDVPLDAETLVAAARRQGKRVGAVPFPTVDTRTPERTADFGLLWQASRTTGRVVELTRADFRREWVPPTWTARPQRRQSYSPIMRARIEWAVPNEVRRDVDVVAYDTTNDARENYDTYRIETRDAEITPDARGWFEISATTASGLHGSWSKFLETSQSLDVRLYWGPISRTDAYPESFRELLDREAGFWPGRPDEHADIDAATFAEQIDRLAGFLTRAQTATIRSVDFDLLLAYQPQIDQAMHNFLGYDDGVINAAFASADRSLATIRTALDPSRDALVVTGDHGVVATQREIRMNRLLAGGGFAPRWRAYTSGSVAHLYRFGGTDDADLVLQKLRSTGFFEHLEKKSAASHPSSGDIVVVAFPEIELSSSTEAPAEAEPHFYGHHGGLNTHRELHTVLFATGAGIPRGSFGELAQTTIARFVSELLGIAPPQMAD